MSVDKYPPLTLAALQDHPSFDIAVTRSEWGLIKAHMLDRPDDQLRGSVFNGRAELIRVDASGGGRGTYLAGAFVQEALVAGATNFRTYAIHPGTVAITSKLFGRDNLCLGMYQGNNLLPFAGSYQQALDHLERRRQEKLAGRPLRHKGIEVRVNLYDAGVRHHLLGSAALAGNVAQQR